MAKRESLTVKQRRELQRAEKVERYKREQARRVRNRRIGIAAAIAAGAAVIALVVVSVVLTPGARYTAGSAGAQVDGAETFTNTAVHVETDVEYEQSPPAGGNHSPVWLNCGVYSEPVPEENAVHSLEHGAVWVTYRPDLLDDGDIQVLRDLLPSTHAILSPYEDMDSAVAVSAWNAQLAVDEVDDERIREFIEEYWRSQDAPEPGASCTGALDGPGKVA
ncbi:MAG TPA: DUF3105 domain-containing protein [Microbacterium sp.]|nr:DUF3105 domain-containing protein [Microbacterium sp.]